LQGPEKRLTWSNEFSDHIKQCAYQDFIFFNLPDMDNSLHKNTSNESLKFFQFLIHLIIRDTLLITDTENLDKKTYHRLIKAYHFDHLLPRYADLSAEQKKYFSLTSIKDWEQRLQSNIIQLQILAEPSTNPSKSV